MLGFASRLVFASLLILPVFAQNYTVTRVIDGDTIEIRSGSNVPITVRLIGVDTPETVHPNKPVEQFGKEAAEFLRKTLEGKQVRVSADTIGDTVDQYGRRLYYVYVDGILVNELIIKEGYGHAYTKYPFTKRNAFVTAQETAMDARKGLWSSAAATPAAPQLNGTALNYRIIEGSVSDYRAAGGEAGATSERPASGDKSVKVKGHTRSDGTQVKSHTRSKPSARKDH